MRQIDEDEIEKQEIDDEVDDSLIHESINQQAMKERVQRQLDAPNTTEEDEYQEDQIHQSNADFNPISQERAVHIREITESDTAGPSTPPNRTSEEGLLVDPDLLSSQLDRLRLTRSESKEPQELDSTPTTTLRQQV